MKAITIRQPWATLIMHRGKDVENRTWGTSFRGRVAIHTSQKLSQLDAIDAAVVMGDFIPSFSASLFLAEIKTQPELYPTGSIIGTVEIVDCVKDHYSPWFFGEYGFLLRHPRPLAAPIPIKGALGFWNLPDDIAKVVEEGRC